MRILLAYDGKPESAGAVRTALALATDAGASVEVLRVLDVPPFFGPDGSHMLWAPEFDVTADRLRATLEQTRSAIAEFGPDAAGWDVEVVPGPAALTIAQIAEERGATLVACGLGRHQLRDRWFGTETALRVMQLSHVPVLASPEDAEGRPGSVLAAVDFSPFSREAVAAALEVASPGAELHLAHVIWDRSRNLEAFRSTQWAEDLRKQAERRLAEWAADLPRSPGHLHTHVLEGEIADELARLTDSLRPDLVAAGSHGLGFLGRLLLGSISTRLVRGSRRSILISPPRERTEPLPSRVAPPG